MPDDIRLLTGDCLHWLRQIKPDSIDCCVTSPPYFGLRDYGTAAWEGGDTRCLHRPDDTPNLRGIASSTLGGGKKHTGHKQEGFASECPRCGAKRVDQQIGLEQTPADFVAKLVEVFREVRRILKPDGTFWLNLGDSYASAWVCNRRNVVGSGSLEDGKRANRPNRLVEGLKEKDLIGIPWRVAFALQADGWYLRQDIIWHKPNPMPESVRDRCTKAHEYVFMFSKSQRYHFDGDAISEPVERGYAGSSFSKGKTAIHLAERIQSGDRIEKETRNKRSVWTVSPKPFKEAHFATFPPDLIRPCILAGCRKGGIVLDPFGGAGTTALVAREHGRKAVLIELNPAYVEIAQRRLYPETQQAAE